MDPLVRERLEQTNGWLFGGPSVGEVAARHLPRPWVPRIQADASTLDAPDRIHLILGPRGVGKESLAWSVLSRRECPLYLNLSEPALRRWCESAGRVRADLVRLGIEPDAVYLAEAHHLPDVHTFLRDLLTPRPGYPVLVTAAASFHRSPAIADDLAGLVRRHELLGLALAEVSTVDGERPEALEEHRRFAFERMLHVGGYPGVWFDGDPERALGDLLGSSLQRDLSELFRVQRAGAYLVLLEECARRVGSLVNASSLAEQAEVSVGTAQRYLALLGEAHVLGFAPAFARGKRREVTSALKAFVLDNGVRNALLGRLGGVGTDSLDRRERLVNWVYTELRKLVPTAQPVRYWRSLSGANVDFVVDPPGALLAVEVRSESLRRRRLARASRSFIQAYEPDELWVLNDTLEDEETIGATRVRWFPHWKLPERTLAWASSVWVAAHRRHGVPAA